MSHHSPEIELIPPPAGTRFAIVRARWNGEITNKLLAGAQSVLEQAGVLDSDIFVVEVPGTFELPLAAHRLAKTGNFHAVICLGVVIQGDTDHDKYINASVSHALQTIALETGLPIPFGVLTCRTMEQARDRAGGSAGHKGEEAALVAIEMVRLLHTLPSGNA